MWIDWVTGLGTLVAMELIARKYWQGWAVGLVNQGLWLWLIYASELYGLLPVTLVLIWRYAVALRKWRREDGSHTHS